MSLAIRATFLPDLQNVIQRLDQAMLQERRLVVLSSALSDLNDLALQMQEEAISRQRIRELNTLALKVLEKANQHLSLASEENLKIKAAIQDTQFLHAILKESIECETNEIDERTQRMIDLKRRELETKYPGYQVSVRVEKVDGQYVLIPEIMF